MFYWNVNYRKIKTVLEPRRLELFSNNTGLIQIFPKKESSKGGVMSSIKAFVAIVVSESDVISFLELQHGSLWRGLVLAGAWFGHEVNVTDEDIVFIYHIGCCVAGTAEKGYGKDVDTRYGGNKRSEVRVVGVSSVGDDAVECNCLISTDVLQTRCQRGKESYWSVSIRLSNSLLV